MPTLTKRAIYVLLLAVSCSLQAAPTDLAGAPLHDLLSSQVKPNILFILDDSGSMQWSYLGDEVANNNYENAVGYRSSLCNKIYYNPQLRYPVPVRADGSAYPQQPFNAALYDGFQPASQAIDLSSGFMAWRSASSVPAVPANTADVTYTPDCFKTDSACPVGGSGLPNLPGPAHYFIYKGQQRDKLGDNSAQDHCKDTGFDTSEAGSNHWIKKIIDASSPPAEQQNFANWFSYHRTRILTMKTAIGRAFRDFDQQFRVGFSTIGYSGTDSANPGFLKLADFDADQRLRFYAKLYAIVPRASTPLRAALSKAGQLYAGKLLTGADDPVQYSCQRHFSILSTDGYWNTNWETASYGPKKIDGSTNVGNQDDSLPRPMYDGSGSNQALPALQLARLSISGIRPARLGYTIVRSIKINGVEIMANNAGVYDTDHPEDDAAAMALAIAAAARLGGFRVTALGTDVLIIAPASAGPLGLSPAVNTPAVNTPVVNSYGSLPISISAFTTVPATGRTANTLADVAAYYYQTDLRTSALGNCRSQPEVCNNNVPVAAGSSASSSASNSAGSHQHMVTYTVGLGANGLLHYQQNYDTAQSGDFFDIKNGNRNWPDPIYFDGPERIDDLWHAAVNGGGKYFSAQDPESLAQALASTMTAIRGSIGAAAAAATSSQEPVEGDNKVFISRYRSVQWDGELEARSFELADGTLGNVALWSAQSLLDARVSGSTDSRQIYVFATDTSNHLKNFIWSVLNTTEQAFFSTVCAAVSSLSQCAQFSSEQTQQASGASLVNYLRGQRGNEDRAENTQRLFRQREHVLGALINAQPVYVGPPAFRYADENYGLFRDEQAAQRKSMVYAAANDGMLHAFNAISGREEWAFIPPAALPLMSQLADRNLGSRFRYVLDASPVVADFCPAAPAAACNKTQWRTILIGGMAAGGRQYYALDITDPDLPKALWIFGSQQDADLGYSFSKPVVSKRRDGRWVVVVGSGYNNLNPGDGQGYLYVLDAASGVLLEKIATHAGSTANPSGLGQINAWVDTVLDNTASRFYGGDLLGNVWRFDMDDVLPPAGKDAVLLASLVKDGRAQPITTRPELSEIRVGGNTVAVVSVATGKYLGLSDLADNSVQSVYTFKDSLQASGLGALRDNPDMIAQTMTQNAGGTERTTSTTAVDWQRNNGWWLDFSTGGNASGERATIDPEQQLGILRIVTNVPGSTACNVGGSSWLYAFDYRSGIYLPLAVNNAAGKKLASTDLVAGVRTVKWRDRTLSILTDEAGNVTQAVDPLPAEPVRPVRRVSWRELDEQ